MTANEDDAAPESASSAIALAGRIASGDISARDVVDACLARIESEDPSIQAWTHVAATPARQQAEAADRARRRGATLGPLHGVPVGIKDIFDTFDMPTGLGTPLYAGRQSRNDASAVQRLREAGAIILGKTVTTEMAVYAPGPTRNPHNVAHTPGGSSSGSAAAVAAGMVPLALGTQTNGSVIRPAAYCGVFGFKPSFGRISREGCLRQSPALDQVGVFATTLADAALMAEILMVYDKEDPAMAPVARPALRRTAAKTPPVPPMLAFCKTPVWEQAESETQEAFAELMEILGEHAVETALPRAFDHAHAYHKAVMEADLARHFERTYERGRDQLSSTLVEMIERGREVRAVDYSRALDGIDVLNHQADGVLNDVDAIITPATAGPAPEGLESTGNPAFCTIWTYCGMPAITLPLMTSQSGLPIGVQLVGAKNDDARLLRTANWLMNVVKG